MVYKHFFGRTPEGQAVTRFTLFNHNTMEVNLLNYGAAVHSICGIGSPIFSMVSLKA